MNRNLIVYGGVGVLVLALLVLVISFAGSNAGRPAAVGVSPASTGDNLDDSGDQMVRRTSPSAGQGTDASRLKGSKLEETPAASEVIDAKVKTKKKNSKRSRRKKTDTKEHPATAGDPTKKKTKVNKTVGFD